MSDVLIDPSAEELDARLGSAALREHLQNQPAGVACVHDMSLEAELLQVAWWRDQLGRRQWVFHDDIDLPSSTGLSVGTAIVWPITGRHPLEWIAPHLACGWRGDEFAIACRCGVVGPPESLGWMGDVCGPCFDRAQEGEPPAGEPVHRPRMDYRPFFKVAPTGRILAGFDHEGQRWIQAWDPPYDGEPLWTRTWEPRCRAAISADGSRYVLESLTGHIVAGDAATGQPLSPDFARPMTRFVLAGANGNRLIGPHHHPGPWSAPWVVGASYTLGAYRIAKSGAVSLMDFTSTRLSYSRVEHVLAVSPDGARVYAVDGEEVRAFDAKTLKCEDRMRLTRAGPVSDLLALPSGAVVAVGGQPRARWMVRWPPPGQAARSWLFGPAAREPDRVALFDGEYERMTAAPDADVFAGLAGGSLWLHDGATLRRVGRFRPAHAVFTGSIAFAPGGRLMAATSLGFAAWPWREAFGTP